MNKLTQRARIITSEIILDGFKKLARDDVLSRVGFGELACQIFDDSAFDILREKLSPGAFFFSPKIDRSIAQVSEAIDGIERYRRRFIFEGGIQTVQDRPGIGPPVHTITRTLVSSQ